MSAQARPVCGRMFTPHGPHPSLRDTLSRGRGRGNYLWDADPGNPCFGRFTLGYCLLTATGGKPLLHNEQLLHGHAVREDKFTPMNWEAAVV